MEIPITLELMQPTLCYRSELVLEISVSSVRVDVKILPYCNI